MSAPEMFPRDPRCHLCGIEVPAEAIHWDHHPDCARGPVCRCDLNVCAACCTDPACAHLRPVEDTVPL